VIILILIGYILLQGREVAEDEADLSERAGEITASGIRAASSIGAGSAPFDSLSHEKQYDLMEDLAKKALSFYDLDLLSVTRLQYRLNATFQIEALPHGAGGPRRYMLRISAPGFHSQANVRSEMQWLRSIRDHTNLIVPDPLHTNTGDLVATIEHPGITEARHCVLLHWLEGKAPYENLTPGIMEKVGRFMGQLHQHAAHFSPPEGFERKKWDLEGMMGETLDVPAHKARSALTTAQIETIEATGRIVNRAMQQLGKDREVFGLIHADLHERNYLLFNDEIRAIDFDTCGEGYYLYDLAVALSTLLRRRDLSALKASLLNGYRQARPLSPEHENLITPFIAARLMTHTFWLAGHKDDRVFRDTAPELIERQVAFLQQFIQRMT
jgi:Ser/Thr protein kinase RdoA (MazF antagonist)